MASQYSIASTNYKLLINSQGAELAGLYWKDLDHNWIWSGESWKRHAPLLFPIVGRLKNDRYTINQKPYELTQHGFARDMEFSVVDSSASEITLKLSSSEKTREKYPYDFNLFVHYEVSNENIKVTFKVHSAQEIYFSLGWHPAFSFPNHQDLMGDLKAIWEKKSTSYHLLNKDGLITPTEIAQSSPLPIEHTTFQKDALVFTQGLGNTVTLSSKEAKAQLSMHTENAPQFGIWSKNAMEFVCLEPWWGCADLENTTQNFQEKFGLQHSLPSEEWSQTIQLKLADYSSE